MFGNYWTGTEDIRRELGGANPTCPTCGLEMYAIDDHGRFRCPNGDDPDSQMANIMRGIRRKPPEEQPDPQ